MAYNVIDLSQLEGPFQEALTRLLDMVPANQREDVNLKKLVAFRLKLDGEKNTAGYLKSMIRAAGRRGFSGRLFDFLVKDGVQKANRQPPDPPDMAG